MCNEYFIMDETDAPFDEDNLPYERTVREDLITIAIAEKQKLEFKEESYIYRLQQAVISARESKTVRMANGYICPKCRTTPSVAVNDKNETVVYCECGVAVY